MRTVLVVLSLIVAAVGATRAADDPRDGMVVSTAWLAAHIRNPDLVLLHVADKAEYDAPIFPAPDRGLPRSPPSPGAHRGRGQHPVRHAGR